MNNIPSTKNTSDQSSDDHDDKQPSIKSLTQLNTRRAMLTGMFGVGLAACDSGSIVSEGGGVSEEQPNPIDPGPGAAKNVLVGVFVDLPATIQAEDYIDHNGILLGNDGVDDFVGWIDNDDYTEYSINVPTAGTYQLQARVASLNKTAQVEFIANGASVGDLTVRATGGWHNWVTLNTTLQLSAGEQTLRLQFSGSRAGLMNINWFSLAPQNDNDRDGEVIYNDRPLNSASAARFLGQAALGAMSEDSIQEVLDKGYEGWINDQMQMPDDANTYDYVTNNDWENRPIGNSARFEGYSAGWMRMVTSPDELRQRMVAALCQIFVLNPRLIDDKSSRFSGASWLDLVSRHAFGSYRDLLGEVSTSEQMGAFLTLVGSRRETDDGAMPDQNYAREVMQLFSIGLVELNLDGTPRLDANGDMIDTYNEEDIEGLARAFTGWESTRVGNDTTFYWLDPMTLNPEQHEPGEKRFLGTTIPAGTDGNESMRMALDFIANHPNVAPFISKLLIQRFIKSNPSPDYVRRVATVFNNDGNGERGNLGAVLKAILMDQEARGIPDRRIEEQGKLREPMISFAHLARFSNPERVTLRRDYVSWGLIYWWQDDFPQAPLASPSVFNFYPTTYTPPNTELNTRGLASPELFILDEPAVVIYSNLLYLIILNTEHRSATYNDYSRFLDDANDVDLLVSKLNLLLAGNSLSPSSIEIIVDSVGSLDADTEEQKMTRIRAVIYLIMISPDYLVQY